MGAIALRHRSEICTLAALGLFVRKVFASSCSFPSLGEWRIFIGWWELPTVPQTLAQRLFGKFSTR